MMYMVIPKVLLTIFFVLTEKYKNELVRNITNL